MAEAPKAPELESLEQEEEPQEQQHQEEEEQHQQETEEAQEAEDEQRDPGSSMISSWGYNREAEELEVTFQNGKTESYGCTPEQWADAASTASAGKWMHANML